MKNMKFAAARQGFTLIELLVVISIIALLVALLLPVLGKARDEARTAQCLANHRGIGQMAALYHDDNMDSFPIRMSNQDPALSSLNPTGFYDFLPAVIRYYITGSWVTIQTSPTNPLPGDYYTYFIAGIPSGPGTLICPGVTDIPAQSGLWLNSYGFNSDSSYGWMHKPDTSRLKVSRVSRPSSKLYALDWQDSAINYINFNSASAATVPGRHVPGVGNFGFVAGGSYLTDWNSDYRNGRHNMQVNVLFIDGHAQTKTSREITNLFHYAGFAATSLYTRDNHMFSIAGR